MEDTNISWADHTFNPWIGCTRVSQDCVNCYAETMMDHRYHRVKWGPGEARQLTSKANWRKPPAWNRDAARTGKRVKDALRAALETGVVSPAHIELLREFRGSPALEEAARKCMVGTCHTQCMMPPPGSRFRCAPRRRSWRRPPFKKPLFRSPQASAPRFIL
jgi:hypothetical protein